MSVTVRIPGPLRPFSQDRSRVVLEGPASVEEALRALPAGVRERVLDERGAVRPHVNVFVGSLSIRETGGLSTPLPDGAELFLIPAVSGGIPAVSGGADEPPAFDASVAHELAAMPDLLRAAAGRLGEAGWLLEPPGGGFCLTEQIWHLADLEREGFALRLRRLLAEDEPFLPDFDGARTARERGYRARSLAAGIEAFAAERAANLALLGSVSAVTWSRSGMQEGVGRVTLADVARAMVSHDRAHQAEIAALSPPR